MTRALVIGSGPNGLAAAITLAQAGMRVEVYEAEAEAGGGARTLPLTLPGFLHDFGSAVHPMAVGSPFFKALPLEKYGLEWVHGPRSAGASTGRWDRCDSGARPEHGGSRAGHGWQAMARTAAAAGGALGGFPEGSLGPVLRMPRHPLRMARFGMSALQPARWLARNEFEWRADARSVCGDGRAFNAEF